MSIKRERNRKLWAKNRKGKRSHGYSGKQMRGGFDFIDRPSFDLSQLLGFVRG